MNKMVHEFKINNKKYELLPNYYQWIIIDENENTIGECIDYKIAKTIVLKQLNKLGKTCLIFRKMII